jgi:hypothetical protein
MLKNSLQNGQKWDFSLKKRVFAGAIRLADSFNANYA